MCMYGTLALIYLYLCLSALKMLSAYLQNLTLIPQCSIFYFKNHANVLITMMIVYELYFVNWSISRYFNFYCILVDTLNRNYVVGVIFQIAKAAMRSGEKTNCTLI